MDPNFRFGIEVKHTNAYPGQLVMSLGRSAINQSESDSVDVSNISTNNLDARRHLKMSRGTSPGDSGGGVFDFYSGRLLGIMTRVENYGERFGQYAERGHVVPIFNIFPGAFQPNWG